MSAEILKNKSTLGGARPGAGRKPGGMNMATKKKLKIEKIFKMKILASVDTLYSAQMKIATGCSYLYRIDKDEKGNSKKPVLVTSQNEIEEYLRGEVDQDSYYYITTDKPDNKAIDSMLDRVFGKAMQSVDLTTKGDKVNNYTDEQITAIANRINSNGGVPSKKKPD